MNSRLMSIRSVLQDEKVLETIHLKMVRMINFACICIKIKK